MPKLSRFFLRGGFICLALGMLAGGLILLQKGTGRFPVFWVLLPAHIYLVLVGGVTQCALGVSYWVLPRHSDGRRRGASAVAWSSYWALNAAIFLVAIHPAIELALGPAAGGGAFVCGGILQGVAAMAFTLHAWPRVRPSHSPLR